MLRLILISTLVLVVFILSFNSILNLNRGWPFYPNDMFSGVPEAKMKFIFLGVDAKSNIVQLYDGHMFPFGNIGSRQLMKEHLQKLMINDVSRAKDILKYFINQSNNNLLEIQVYKFDEAEDRKDLILTVKKDI
jgi:hypothetical protein